ncbi:MAG: tripartite tricarboxylate transporter substrate binding protein [Proteobacteria bacterium]|nr:tripartite tricarboxylate transporter substrate binding protein [Burkholderiales bacterium]
MTVSARVAAAFGISLAGVLALTVLSAPVWAQEKYPSRAVRMIVPFPAAGVTDLAARQVGQRLNEAWGQPVVIDNRPGAGGTIGTELAAKALADGYTLMMGSVSTHAIAPSLYAKPGYDPLKDFAAITEIATTPNVLVVNAALPVKNLKELVALARKRPGELTFGSNGNGTNNHLAGEMLQAVTGIKLQHVPYKGSAFATSDLLGGHISMMFDVVLTPLPMVKAGKLRPLATAAAKRSPVLPDVPTAAESGLGDFQVLVWLGLWAPANVPQEILNKIHADTVAGLRTPKMQDFFLSQGAEVVASTPAQFTTHIRDETARWKKVIDSAKVRLD